MSCHEEQAWAAGLFDGEGSIGLAGGWLKLQLKMVDRETVERFRLAVGRGVTYGPYANRSGERDGYQRSDFYMWVALRGASLPVLNLLWPWLSEVRRARAMELGYSPPRENTGVAA